MADTRKEARDRDAGRALFMISIAAELAGMHPQTLRMYERKGLVSPKRSRKHTRLYSMDDVDRLRYIQELTSERGLNLAGVEYALELEERIQELEEQLEQTEAELECRVKEAQEEIDRVHRSYRKELVPAPNRHVMVVGRGRGRSRR